MAKKKKLRVAIQGIAASFHEVAAMTYFSEGIETVECLSFHQLCESLKEDLKNKIANTPDLAEEKKKEIEARITELDSASSDMMVWMRKFNPLPDSLGEEKAREYLENEMEKIKKVREDVLAAIEKAKTEQQ